MTIRLFPWPARRPAADAVAIGYESGFLPGTFEPAETLGDTDPMPLDEAEAHAQKLEAAAWWPEFLMFVVCAGCILACAFLAGLLP
jgi:hypothetical protein